MTISFPLKHPSPSKSVVLICGDTTKAVNVNYEQFFEPDFVEFVKACEDPQKIVAVGSRLDLHKLRVAIRDSKNPAIDKSLARSIDVIIRG